MEPSVGIILLNWNSYEVTKDCLDCFRQIRHPYRLIVVDNGSSDDSVTLFRANYPEITLIENNENLGFAGGNNCGLEHGLRENLDYLMLLNNDTLFDEDFVAPLVQRMQQNAELGGIQPKIMYNHDRSLIWNAGGTYHYFLGHSSTIGEGKPDLSRFNRVRGVDWITGCCILLRSQVVQQVGLLDDRFFIYHEDVDWSLRIRGAGWKLEYFPQSQLYHIAGVSQKSKVKTREGFLSPRTHYLNLRNQVFVIRKHLNWYHFPTATLFMLVMAVAYVAYFTVRGRFKKLTAVYEGLKDGFFSSI